jgi:hypothetical protein
MWFKEVGWVVCMHTLIHEDSDPTALIIPPIPHEADFMASVTRIEGIDGCKFRYSMGCRAEG